MKIITRTERFQIRELRKEDFDEVYALNSDQEVMRYHYPDGKIRTEAQEAKIFINILKGYSSNKKIGIWGVFKKDTDEFIGLASLLPLKETGEHQAGVRIKKKFWNQGFGSEIMKAMIDYGIFNLDLPRIVALTNPRNRESMRLLEKAGFKWEKIIKADNQDMNYYSINKFTVN